MRIFYLAICVALFFAGPALAHDDAAHEDIVIKVNGMVCDFCAQSVWKVFEDYEAVDTVDVSLNEGHVTVHLKPGQTLADADLDQAITYAGYDLVSVTRSQYKG